MPPSADQRPSGPSRRSLLAAGAVAALTAGCAVGGRDPEDHPPAAATGPGLSPDVTIAVQATTGINAMIAAVRATTAAFPGLGPALTPLDAMHTAHLQAVQDAVPDGVETSPDASGYVVPADRESALAGLTTAERTHHDQLVGLALRAESGLFAGLLGRMAASVSQHLAVLG